jgi:hypothetical protein
MDGRTLGRVEKKLRDSPVERAGDLSRVVLWGFDGKVEIALRDER